MEQISQRINHLSDGRDAEELRALLNAIVDGVRALAVKLDADATVTDTNYAATFDAIIKK